MIKFRNKKEIEAWTVNLENHLTMLKAQIKCEERQCRIVSSTTDGFVWKETARDSAERIQNCASMIKGYLQ